MSYECKICGRVLQKKFPMHLENMHGLTRKQYYDQYLKQDGDGECKNCGESTEFCSKAHGLGYNTFCSRSCSFSYTHKQIQADDVKREAWSKGSSEVLSRMWENPAIRDRWTEQIRQFQSNSGGVEAHVKRLRAQDPEYDKYIAEVRANNGFSNLWKQQWFRDVRKECVSKQSSDQVADPNNGWGKRHGNRYQHKQYVLKSSWELEFAEFLDKVGFSWTYEELQFEWTDHRHYRPDFYIRDLNLVIEIKPSHFIDETAASKLLFVESKGYEVEFLTEINWAFSSR